MHFITALALPLTVTLETREEEGEEQEVAGICHRIRPAAKAFTIRLKSFLLARLLCFMSYQHFRESDGCTRRIHHEKQVMSQSATHSTAWLKLFKAFRSNLFYSEVRVNSLMKLNQTWLEASNEASKSPYFPESFPHHVSQMYGEAFQV